MKGEEWDDGKGINMDSLMKYMRGRKGKGNNINCCKLERARGSEIMCVCVCNYFV